MDTEEIIDKYYLDELTPEERVLMQRRLREDADFKAEFDFQENLRRAIRDTERDSLKEKLIGFERTQAKGTAKKHWKIWQIAASITILLCIAGLAYYVNTQDDSQKLYAKNYEPYPNTVFNITRGEGTASLEREAFTAYEANDYETAITLFEKLNAQGERTAISFYLGQSLLAANHPKQSLAIFERLIQEQDDFSAEARWYAALTELKLQDKPSAIKLLRKIIEADGYQAIKARGLLKKLEQENDI